MLVLLQKLERDAEYRFMLLFSIGSYTGLRYGDLCKLKWSDMLGHEKLVVVEGKTKKERVVHINLHLSEIVERTYKQIGIEDVDELIFANKDGNKPINIQYVNRRLKQLAAKYNIFLIRR